MNQSLFTDYLSLAFGILGIIATVVMGMRDREGGVPLQTIFVKAILTLGAVLVLIIILSVIQGFIDGWQRAGEIAMPATDMAMTSQPTGITGTSAPVPTLTSTGEAVPAVVVSSVPASVTSLAYLLEKLPDVARGLGDVKAIVAGEDGVAIQAFEHGLMLYRNAVSAEAGIYVLYDDNTWQTVADTFNTRTPPVPENFRPPPGLYQPIRGFGQAWYDEIQVREALGWALSCEMNVDILRQPFDKGLIIRVERVKYYENELLGDSTCRAAEVAEGQTEGRTFALVNTPGESRHGSWYELGDN